MKLYLYCCTLNLRSHHELSIAVEKENTFENKPSINLMGEHLSKEAKQSFMKSKHKLFIWHKKEQGKICVNIVHPGIYVLIFTMYYHVSNNMKQPYFRNSSNMWLNNYNQFDTLILVKKEIAAFHQIKTKLAFKSKFTAWNYFFFFQTCWLNMIHICIWIPSESF